ncbi:DNA repair and recombination protein RadA [Halomicrococcus gelatinilyticus]|uniref:DNA repair and recombination protein RadA n=1 Tax=Halomicrococcus gelatinilyticus TaxID=1702103 RepID=UPI002E0DAD9A
MGGGDIDRLPAVGPATGEQLSDAGFDSCLALAVASPRELSTATDIGEGTAHDVIQAARDAVDLGEFETGRALLERRNRIGRISLLDEEVGALFGGGIETQSITEFYGEFGSGKSQFTHQLCVNVQLPETHGGLGGRAIFIDSEDTFRPDRIESMVRGLPTSVRTALLAQRDIEGGPTDHDTLETLVEDVLDRIHVTKAVTSDHQTLLAEKAQELASEYADTGWPVRLVCVDSLVGHFRVEYPGRGKLAERQQKLNKHLHDLLRIANLYNAGIVVTNQVTADPDSFFGDPTRPVGGHILGHASNVRVYLRKARGDKRIVRLVDSPNLPDGEAVVRIVEDGIVPEELC